MEIVPMPMHHNASMKQMVAFMAVTVGLAGLGCLMGQRMRIAQADCEEQYAEQVRRNMEAPGGTVLQRHFWACSVSYNNNTAPDTEWWNGTWWWRNDMAATLNASLSAIPASAPANAIN